MIPSLTRRRFLQHSAGLAAGVAGVANIAAFGGSSLAAADKPPLFKISLAQWSLHRAFFGKKLDPIDFAKIARQDYAIEAIEYVNQFYKGKATDAKYLADLKKRAEDNGVKSVLIMCDGEGALGDANEARRKQAVLNHHKWVDAGRFLGCHSIRVNAHSTGSYEEQMQRAADGLAQLTEYGAKNGLNIIVENHGGLSSNGEWLAAVIKKVNNPRCGTLPDFGNFNLGMGKQYDRYKGVAEMMPFAKGVSAKSHDFDDKGEETHTDYHRMLKIVLDAGYHGYVGIEYEGSKLSEPDGIRATKKLLEKVRAEMSGGK